ncbi:hypothetical protein DM02DRAFT_702275 [Periconia macrospinosa]|uniref:Uncharacterized protein n=1 Tax=Periconia macrospinosa TaxID=97972 RepID=A0A2V1D1T0_9PLEO|nr:hypothetical protein DM02DRAFT_702275 [Periconia macrospinosa]
MIRTIYLAVFTNGPNPAHWGIWVPSGGKGELGKMIHTTGNPAVGFFLEFKRNYNLASTGTLHEVIPLGQVQDNFVSDGPVAMPETKDTTARDRLESTATTVPPPPKSANPFDPAAPNCVRTVLESVPRYI